MITRLISIFLILGVAFTQTALAYAPVQLPHSQLINNKGDIGKTLNDLGQSQNVKALVTAMVTAGMLQGLNATAGIQKVNAKSTFTEQLQKNLINNTASTVVNHAINGGDLQQQLEQSIRSAFIDTGSAQSANQIGDLYQNGKLNDYTHQLAHAIAGCAAGAATSNDCSSGALGAVVGEMSAELYGGNRTNATNLNLNGLQTNTVNFARMMAGIAVAITGGDANAINLAASAGGNAAQNNYLNHKEVLALKDKQAQCNGDAACMLKVVDEYLNLSVVNDKAMQSECAANPTSPSCQGRVQDALNYVGDKQETSGILESMGSDINRSRVVALDQTLNDGSYGAVNNINTRADFFGAMYTQTGAPWFSPAEDVSRNDLQGLMFNAGDSLNGGHLSAWRDAAGNEIMKNGLNNFRSIYNDPSVNINTWSVNQLVHEQNDPKLQAIHQQYVPNFIYFTQDFMQWEGGVNNILVPADRIKAGCIQMGMPAGCGGAR